VTPVGDIYNGDKKYEITAQLESSEINIYNFADSSFSTILKHHFNNEHISTNTQGFHKILNTGDVYVENQNDGVIYIMNEDKIKLKHVFETSLENMIERPQWMRIYENINY
jgi:hypothetical protein